MKIFYHPSIVVYHHRRSIIIPHLKQISRYALHRGHFARIFPDNSRKLSYFIPSIFFLYILSIPIAHFLYPLCLYVLFLLLTFIDFLIKKNNLFLSILATISIPPTHLYYGLLFMVGFLKKDLGYKSHPVNKSTGHYIGG